MNESTITADGPRQRRPQSLVPWLLVAVLSGWSGWLTIQRYAPQWLETAAQRTVKDVQREVAALLKDPESARFEHVWLGPDGKYACGDVNAKNSMGGYTGRTSFMLQRSSGRVEFMPAEDSSASAKEQLEQIEKKIKFLEDVKRLCGAPPPGAD